MNTDLTDSDQIDYNLYPALVQVFAIILIGYFAGHFQVLSKQQTFGLNKFVSTFSLPCLIFKNLAVVNFKTVNWLFLTSVLLSKTFIFFLAFSVTLFALRPINIGMAAVFGIFVSQSNDFALGYPILKAIYSQTHPEYLDYIYLLAPISLVIINPIAFLFMETNELINTQVKTKKEFQSDSDSINSTDNEIKDIENIDKPKVSIALKGFSKLALLKSIFFGTISNPIVFMTFIGLISNVLLNQHIPRLLEPILTSISNSFSALALFYLGHTMVGRIRNLTLSSIIIILILVLTKSVVYPLINRELIIHLNKIINFTQPNNSDIDSLSSFSFLYGTFPTAPSLFVFISRYKYLSDNLISAAVVLGTIGSAPLMMISGKMISLKYNDSIASNFEEIECKTAYGFSFLTWFCCIWVLYIFVAAGRIFKRTHLFTFYLIIFQMLLAVIHIFWSNITTNIKNLNPLYSLIHLGFVLFIQFTTRCLPFSIILNLIKNTEMNTINNGGIFKIVTKISSNQILIYGVGFFLPFMATVICLLIGQVPDNLSMIIILNRYQIIVSNIVLLLIIIFVFYSILVFVRIKNEKSNFYRLITDNEENTSNLLISENNSVSHSIDEITFETVDNSRTFAFELNESLTYSDMSFLDEEYKIMHHLSLVITLTFNSLLTLFFQLWLLYDENKSGIFYELKLIQTTLLFGQGFFTFLSFGMDNLYIISPILFKLKVFFGFIKPFNLPLIQQVPQETIDFCKKFERLYQSKCLKILRNIKFHHRYYSGVFRGNDLVDWLIKKKIATSRSEAEKLGKKLIDGRIICHVTHNRSFYDGYHLYKFNFFQN